MPVADAHVQVAVDPVEMDQVQLLERGPITRLRALHELADVLGRLTRCFLLGRLGAHGFVLPRQPVLNQRGRRG